MTDDPIPTEPDDESLPTQLRADLARLSPFVQVPQSVDVAVLSRAKADYARRARFRLAMRWASIAATVAAVVAVVFIARMALVHSDRPFARAVPDSKPGVAPRALPGDINGDGKIDMLDAFILARRLASGARVDPSWDVNGDGVVDQRDVDWIVKESVTLRTGDPASGGASQ